MTWVRSGGTCIACRPSRAADRPVQPSPITGVRGPQQLDWGPGSKAATGLYWGPITASRVIKLLAFQLYFGFMFTALTPLHRQLQSVGNYSPLQHSVAHFTTNIRPETSAKLRFFQVA